MALDHGYGLKLSVMSCNGQIQPDGHVIGTTDAVITDCTLTVIRSSPMNICTQKDPLFLARIFFLFILCVGAVVVSMLTFRVREPYRSQIMVIRW